MQLGTQGDVILTRRIPHLLVLAWIVIGIIVAANRHYFAHLQTASDVGSAVLAVIVWPLVLLHVHIGT